VAFNRGRRSRRGSRVRGRRRNPGGGGALSIRSPLKAVTAGFNVGTLSKAAVVVSGALGNAWLSGFVGGYMPGMLRSEPGNFITGLATAGLLSAGVGMVSPKFAGPIFFGGVLEVVTRAFKKYVGPMIGLKGLGDYLSRSDAAGARPLGQYMGDYLSRSDAAGARPLGDYGGDDYISEELAGM
jgi:hypothetical protein